MAFIYLLGLESSAGWCNGRPISIQPGALMEFDDYTEAHFASDLVSSGSARLYTGEVDLTDGTTGYVEDGYLVEEEEEEEVEQPEEQEVAEALPESQQVNEAATPAEPDADSPAKKSKKKSKKS